MTQTWHRIALSHPKDSWDSNHTHLLMSVWLECLGNANALAEKSALNTGIGGYTRCIYA